MRLDLELWLIGTSAELDTAAHALAEVGRVVYRSERQPLVGADAGRLRLYARLHLPTTAPSGRPSPAGVALGNGALIDLDSARNPDR